MFLKEESLDMVMEKEAGYRKGGEPSMDDVERLHREILERFNPEPSLSVKQDLTLRQACYKVLADNPGVPWSALVLGAGVYLRFIEAYPNLAIPEPPAAGSQ